MDPRIVTSGTASILTTAVGDASAWRAGDFSGDESWIVSLSDAAIAEIDAALRSAQRQAISIETVTRDGFPLPTLAKLLAEVRLELEYGRGFVLLRGIPVERYSDEEAGLLYRGIGTHIGSVVSQNAKGDLLGHVFDRGYADYRGRSDVRGYQTRAELEFHTDVVDIVGLLCLRVAKEGGQSLIVSSTTIHNEMLVHEPWLLGLLYGNFLFDRRGEEVGAEKSYFVSPILHYHQGYLSCRSAIIEYIYSAQEKLALRSARHSARRLRPSCDIQPARICSFA